MDSRVSVLEDLVETLVFGWTLGPWNPNSQMRTPSISCTVGGKVGYFYTQRFRMFPVAQFSCHCHRRTNYSKSCYKQLDVCYNNSQLENSSAKMLCINLTKKTHQYQVSLLREEVSKLTQERSDRDRFFAATKNKVGVLGCLERIWVVVLNMFYFNLYLGEDSHFD